MQKRTKIIVLILSILLLLLSTGFLVYKFLPKKSSSLTTTNEAGFSGLLTPKSDLDISNSTTISKSIGPAGGTMRVNFEGFTYTLTVPQEILPMNYDISLTPLISSPINGYEREDFGRGVLIEPDGSLFGTPAYLTVKKESSITDPEPKWGYCNLGSKGYDPEICLGDDEYPFNFGVEAGKIALLAKSETSLSFMPTVPSGDENIVNAKIWGGGAYLFDSVNKIELEQLVSNELIYASDFSSEVEPFAHLAAYEVDLTKYKSKITDFKRSQSSFPRTLFEAVIVAGNANEILTGQEKLAEFFSEYEKSFSSARSGYLPWTSYYSTLTQIETLLAPDASSVFTRKAHAKSKPNRSKKAGENVMSVDRDTYLKVLAQKQAALKAARDALFNDSLSPSERLNAMDIINASKAATDEDKRKAAEVLVAAAEQAPTVAECERIAEIARSKGNTTAEYTAQARMQKILDKYDNCKDPKKKDLSNFGMNDCP